MQDAPPYFPAIDLLTPTNMTAVSANMNMHQTGMDSILRALFVPIQLPLGLCHAFGAT